MTDKPITDDALLDQVAAIIDPVWMNPPEGPHLLDNYPGQASKYRTKAREKAAEILALTRTPPSDEMVEAGALAAIAARFDKSKHPLLTIWGMDYAYRCKGQNSPTWQNALTEIRAAIAAMQSRS